MAVPPRFLAIIPTFVELVSVEWRLLLVVAAGPRQPREPKEDGDQREKPPQNNPHLTPLHVTNGRRSADLYLGQNRKRRGSRF